MHFTLAKIVIICVWRSRQSCRNSRYACVFELLAFIGSLQNSTYCLICGNHGDSVSLCVRCGVRLPFRMYLSHRIMSSAAQFLENRMNDYDYNENTL